MVLSIEENIQQNKWATERILKVDSSVVHLLDTKLSR